MTVDLHGLKKLHDIGADFFLATYQGKQCYARYADNADEIVLQELLNVCQNCKPYLGCDILLLCEDELQTIATLDVKDFCGFCTKAEERLANLLLPNEAIAINLLIQGSVPYLQINGQGILGAKTSIIYKAILDKAREENAEPIE